jgi:CheY-like chemotaxis protein
MAGGLCGPCDGYVAAIQRAIQVLKISARRRSDLHWRGSVSETKPRVILCVDDDPKALMARRLVLSTAGYDVLTALSGEDALRILHRRRVDLVIADAFLPRFQGAAITNAIKSHDPQIRVVLLTGAPELPSGLKADLVLIKGRAPAAFLAEIAAVLDRPAEKLDSASET